MNKKVAIIVPNYNGQKYLDDLFESLNNLDYSKELWKLVFVDDTSSDDSFEYAKSHFENAHFIKNEKNMGFTGTNNIGANWAIENNFDYLLLLNQDTIVASNLLSVLVDAMEKNPEIGSIQPKMLLHPKIDCFNNIGNNIHFLGFGYGNASEVKDVGQFDKFCFVNYCSGACVMLRTEIIKKIGLFDYEMFFDLEDLDIGWRLQLCGYKNAYEPKTFIYHKYKFSQNPKRLYHTEKNRFIVLLKNYKTRTILLLLPMLIIMELGLILFATKNKWIKSKLKSYTFFFKPSSWKYIRRKKSRINKLRIAKDADLIKTFTSVIKFQGVENPILTYIGNPIMKIYYLIIKNIIVW